MSIHVHVIAAVVVVVLISIKVLGSSKHCADIEAS